MQNRIVKNVSFVRVSVLALGLLVIGQNQARAADTNTTLWTAGAGCVVGGLAGVMAFESYRAGIGMCVVGGAIAGGGMAVAAEAPKESDLVDAKEEISSSDE